MNATDVTKKAITRHFTRNVSPKVTPINGKNRNISRCLPTLDVEVRVGRSLARIQELEFKNTKTQGRHLGEKIAPLGFRVLEFEVAGKGAKGASAHRKRLASA